MTQGEVDWSAGVKLSDGHTPESLRRSAKIALERANEWIDTAERLLAKADSIRNLGGAGQ